MEAYRSIELPEECPKDTTIKARNWKEALLERIKDIPEWRFQASIREVRSDKFGYSVTREFGMVYVDKYNLETEETLWMKMIYSYQELII